ncbi:hypothetical protein GH714_040020 [Hevea brasiliensis]|uniref:RRM domain-containing protein n=1 Tax=Hevea brasiliensis TaxID=3981 RepID=A0A6A6M3R5_HEVBR|nr:hypothetical protein GH714_040020 [Hevea brasiliensis]
MDAEIGFSQISPPAFDGENYQMWAVRMEAYLQALDVWEPVEEADFHIPALPENPTLAQLRHHKERKTKKTKAKAILFAAVSSSIFTRIMTLESANAIWNYLRDEYQGNERIKGMKVLNLIKEFEVLKMKESETIKEYSDKLLKIANQEVVAQSTAEAEFVAATAAVNQAIWLKKILSFTTGARARHKILVDNQAAIAISLNPVFHGLLIAKVIYERDAGRSRGFGFVSFESVENAEAALNAMNGVEVEGRPVRLNLAATLEANTEDNLDSSELLSSIGS